MNATRIIRNKELRFMEIKIGAEEIYSIRKHSHKELCIGIIEKGSSCTRCKTLEFDLQINDVILIPPETVHLCQPEKKDRNKFVMFYMNPEWIKETFELDSHRIEACQARLNEVDLKVSSEFLTSFQSDDDPFKIESNAILFIGRLLFDIFRIEVSGNPSPSVAKNIVQAKTYMDENFTEDIRLVDLEKICGLSRFSFLRQFSKSYKLTPHSYLLNKRVCLAKEMLLKNRTVSETAVMCGFFDQSHFVKTFRMYTGINPTDYK